MLALMTLAMPMVAQASVVIAVSENELIERADTIVFGAVVRTSTKVAPGGRVTTVAELQVFRGLRGAKLGEIITVEFPGGRVGGLVSYAAGAPVLRPGDSVFAFMKTTRGIRRPLGLAYGVLKARSDGLGSYRLFRDTSDLILLTPAGKPAPVTMTRLEDVALEDMVQRVQRRLSLIGVRSVTEVAR